MTTSPSFILGIESSCDETAAAIIALESSLSFEKNTCPQGRILSHVLHSQMREHRAYGGVVPELGARAHLDKIHDVVSQALKEANIVASDLSAIAVTGGPGLIGGVVVGVMFAKAFAAALNKPFIAVNHLEGHALTVRLTHSVPFPYLLLLASGGHCQFLEVRDLGKYTLLGETIDDAIGEAFDKVARMLNLPYPGGPCIEKLAKAGNPSTIDFPRPLLGRNDCNFSLSGLKTAVRQYIQKNSDARREDIAASFQKAVIDCMVDRSQQAIKKMDPKIRTFVLAGGVAANQSIYKALEDVSISHNLNFYAPPIPLCTDNAAMIAWAGLEYFRRGRHDGLSFEPRPRWPLSSL